MLQGPQDRVNNIVQVLSQVLGQESKDKVAVLLQEIVFPAIAAIRLYAGEMLFSVHFQHDRRIGREKIDLQRPASIYKGR